MKLKPCFVCGRKPLEAGPVGNDEPPDSWVVDCFGGCGKDILDHTISVYGKTASDATKRWNTIMSKRSTAAQPPASPQEPR